MHLMVIKQVARAAAIQAGVAICSYFAKVSESAKSNTIEKKEIPAGNGRIHSEIKTYLDLQKENQ